LLDIAERCTNAYVYDPDTILTAIDRLQAQPSIDRVLFAMKSNANPDVLRLIAAAGAGFECVSPQEVEHLLTAVPALDRARILFTPNFAPRSDYAWAIENDIRLTLDNLYPLEAWPELFDGVALFVRIDPELGRGHHEHVITAGEHSKFGIPRFEVDALVSLVEAAGARVCGIHAHSGSGIPESDTWGRVATVLAEVAKRFPEADVLDLGGGLGVPARPGDPLFDLDGMNAALAPVRARYPNYRVWIEPGRFLVAESGVLLTHVTQLKGKGEKRYVGVATGMNALIRPSLYGAHHEIVNLSRIDEPATETLTVVGPICETGDTLGRDRRLPPCRENDVILLLNAGAYGRVMASSYNLRPIPEEILLPRS
jgi:diaminopimelate decarboxylase/aspartate kinase